MELFSHNLTTSKIPKVNKMFHLISRHPLNDRRSKPTWTNQYGHEIAMATHKAGELFIDADFPVKKVDKYLQFGIEVRNVGV